MGISQLENKGFAFLNTDRLLNDKTRQIIVIGTARGGTSLVAGALHHLGIFTGEKSNPPVFEDVLLSEAFENGNINLAQDICDKYCRRHKLWAWKRPAALNYLEEVEKVFPNPFYIFIFKDIFAIANRNNISMQADVSTGLNNALKDYEKIVKFASSTASPMMLVSAEKALQYKESFVEALVEVNKPINDCSDKKADALKFITPNPKDYLDQTRNSKSIGTVDLIDRTTISGWAKSVHHTRPVTIEIYINQSLHAETLADKFRIDLQEKGIHPDGVCGFVYHFDKNIEDIFPCLVEVKVKDDVTNLKNGSKEI